MNILVVVDMQNDFIQGSLANAKGKEVEDAVIEEIKKDYDYFFLTRDSHPENYLETYEGKNLPIKHCIKGSTGWQIKISIVEAVLQTGKPYLTFDKDGFGSFELADYLYKMTDKIDSITIVGLCSDICVITNALILRAKFPNIPIYYIEEAMYATSSENQEAAIKILEACQIYKKL